MSVKYTEMAVQAIGFADLFNMTFKEPLKGPLSYRIELGTPDGPSTGGGKQAQQPVKLVPVGEGVTLVMGLCNPVAKTAEIRSYEYMAGMHAQRFKGETVPLEPVEYRKLVGKMDRFLKNEQFNVTITPGAQPAAAPAAAPAARQAARAAPAEEPIVVPGKPSMMPLIIAGVVAGLAIVAAIAYLALR